MPRNDKKDMITISLRIPETLLDMVEQAMEIEGFRNRSEYVRAIITRAVIKTIKKGKK
ncbi:MAG: ribbon-helix-helix domain-containing protein [Thaumarchaeota archaeon]|jgi:metal-responsive CopG/Arc/MetJ family transcriptional regulator|nr:ribbon-helix-helix domain-containing protein [Candidatus Geocrenenecus arthurdayi]